MGNKYCNGEQCNFVEICVGRVTHYYLRLAESYLEEESNWVKVSNRSSPEICPHKRFERFDIYLMRQIQRRNLNKTSTNTKSYSEKYRY